MHNTQTTEKGEPKQAIVTTVRMAHPLWIQLRYASIHLQRSAKDIVNEAVTAWLARTEYPGKGLSQ